MTFAAPGLLVGLVLVPLGLAAYLAIQRRRGRYAVRFTNVDLLAIKGEIANLDELIPRGHWYY